MTKLVKLTKFEEMTGYTPKAVQRKVQDGIWLLDYEVLKAPDGNLLVIMEGYERWAAGQPRVAFAPQGTESKSASSGGAKKSAQPSL